MAKDTDTRAAGRLLPATASQQPYAGCGAASHHRCLQERRAEILMDIASYLPSVFAVSILVCIHISLLLMYLLPPPQSPTHAPNHWTAIFSRSDNETQCGFEGNNDIYGVGIRIGIYAQVLAVWFANYFLFSEAQVLRDSVSIFSVALLIVALIYASNPQHVYAVEGFVLLQILAWSCIMGVRAKSSYSRGIFSRGSLVRKGVCEIVNLINIGLHVWFWWVGVGQMKTTPCGTYIMMYVVKTGMFGWARKVMMAMSLFVLICTVYWASVELLRPWTMWKISKARRDFTEAVNGWIQIKSEAADPASIVEQEHKDARSVCEDVDDACSRPSCFHCSPIDPHFSFDREATLVVSPKHKSAAETGQNIMSPQTSIDEICSAKSSKSSMEHQTIPAPADPAVLREVKEGELYIQHCVSASPYQMSADGKPLAFSVIVKSIFFPAKYRIKNVDSKPPSWFRCHLYTWTLFLTCRFPPQAFIIYSHLRQTRLLDPLNGPFQLYAAVTYKPASGEGLPKWSSVSLASSLMLAGAELPKKVWLGWYYMFLDLVIHIIVILQLELTLQWNTVRGLSGLWTSVGQLIPFIIGVGGLILVGSRWSIRLCTKWRRGAGLKSGWGKNGLLADEDYPEDMRCETFGLQESIREDYASWRDSRDK